MAACDFGLTIQHERPQNFFLWQQQGKYITTATEAAQCLWRPGFRKAHHLVHDWARLQSGIRIDRKG